MGVDQLFIVIAFIRLRDASDLGRQIPIGWTIPGREPSAAFDFNPMTPKPKTVFQSIVSVAELDAAAVTDVE
ncbi:MAG: hypothetical protein E5Y89_15655 [Mesorhizobium sp.]|nr:MAG: hypothetical protein E5Y89_15655 [Mesorhizobium sp.]